MQEQINKVRNVERDEQRVHLLSVAQMLRFNVG